MTSFKRLSLGLILASSTALAGVDYSKQIMPTQLCTGTRVITDDGYSGVIKGLFLDQRTASVQIDGYRNYDSVPIDNLALTNLCNREQSICAGDRVITRDGYPASVVAIFPNKPAAMVNIDGYGVHNYDEMSFDDIAVMDACEDIGGCRYHHKRLSVHRGPQSPVRP